MYQIDEEDITNIPFRIEKSNNHHIDLQACTNAISTLFPKKKTKVNMKLHQKRMNLEKIRVSWAWH